MLRSAILCVLLLHGVCKFSTRAHPGSTETRVLNFPAFASLKRNDTDVQVEPRVLFNFINSNITIFYVNGTLSGTTAATTAATRASTTYPTQISPAEGYLVTIGIGAHKLHSHQRTWSDARQICIDEGGDLAVIRSEAEEKIVAKMVKESDRYNPWIGYHDKFGNGDLISVFNESLVDIGWVHWLASSNRDARNKCAGYYVLQGNVGMNAEACYENKSFICKITTI